MRNGKGAARLVRLWRTDMPDIEQFKGLRQILQLSFCSLTSIGSASPKSGSAKTRTYRTITDNAIGAKVRADLAHVHIVP